MVTKPEVKCSEQGCEQKGNATTYCFFHCTGRHAMHKKHIEKMMKEESFDFLVHCPVCGDNLDPKVTTKLFLTFEQSDNSYDEIQVDPVVGYDKFECKCQRTMKVAGPNEFDVGPCYCKRGEDMSPFVRCRLCFGPYHEGSKCNFKNPDFNEYRGCMVRRQCPTCFSYSISKSRPTKDGDPRQKCGVCKELACGHCL